MNLYESSLFAESPLVQYKDDIGGCAYVQTKILFFLLQIVIKYCEFWGVLYLHTVAKKKSEK